MRLLIQHRSRYEYPKPAHLGAQMVRLRPAQHAKARIESYGLHISPDADIRWQQDPSGNHVARVSFEGRPPTKHFEALVEIAADIHPVNPFDFFVDETAKTLPFDYPEALKPELLPYLASIQPTTHETRLGRFLAEVKREGNTVDAIVALNAAVRKRINYIIREEPGVWAPEETLTHARGSCRDSALLLVACLRDMGLAARFVSGYLVQLTDEGMIPDQPKGMSRDVVDLHAWAEVYLPGAGWIGLDGTSGLLCGEGHIPLACTASPSMAAPIEGTTDVPADKVSFSLTVARLGHEPRPTNPFPDTTWTELLAAGDQTDERLKNLGLKLTMGGEPTFNARDETEKPEWNGEALGESKWRLGLRLAEELRKRLAPGGTFLVRQGKLYPGEPLPRWALEIYSRRDGKPLWDEAFKATAPTGGIVAARRFAEALAQRLGVPDSIHPAYEDPWPWVVDEERLPVEDDPLKANLKDSLERRRLAHLLDRGLNTESGYVLPLAWEKGAWQTNRWHFRRGHLFLVPGDSPLGLRLPLKSLSEGRTPNPPSEEPLPSPDPRTEEPDTKQKKAAAKLPPPPPKPIRTALGIEPREGKLYVFLPPLEDAESFYELIGAIDATRHATKLDVQLEGYPPVSSPELFRFAVTPDPGVLEVNLPPTSNAREYVQLSETVFDAALHSGLHAEKYMLDGRLAGSGGGHHLTFGGPTPLSSPFVQRPDLLASLVTFAQHHPSLSYLFTGLFVGPTSQAPRLDEARMDSLDALEIAAIRAFDRTKENPPWQSDLLFRHILVDVAGNTHRTEISIDKLFGTGGASSRQGLVELRAFEMPPHVRLVVAQMLLARAIVTVLAEEPYQKKPVRWGQRLHDQFLLPHFLWRDLQDVVAYLAAHGIALPVEAYRPFLELRCPLAGRLQLGDINVEVRNAFEPWPVLGEESTASGTSRFVDSSMERIEVLADGLVPERHVVMVNGHELPLTPVERAGRFVAGVKFRAWAPPHSLHAHLGIHHPIRLEVLDTWAKRSLGACAYHVWHPEGRGYETPPLTRFEAAARRVRRFTDEGPTPWPAEAIRTAASETQPTTLDLRRLPIDRPMPVATEEKS